MLNNIFGSIPSNSASSLQTIPTQSAALNAPNLFSFPNNGPLANSSLGWTGSGAIGADANSHAPPPASPFSLGGIYSGSFGSAIAPGSPVSGGQKPKIDLFNTAAVPTASNIAQSYLNSVPVYASAPKNVPSGVSDLSSGMPALPPAASNVQLSRTVPDPMPTPPNNIHHPDANPSEMRTRLLALSASPSPTDATMLRTVRPAELPPSDYRRDVMAGDRHTFAYVTNLRNVGAAIRVWRRQEGVNMKTNPFLNPASLSLKEYVGNCTDMHMTTYKDDTVIAVGDAQGNISIHMFPTTPKPASASTPTSTVSDAKYCVLRIVPSAGTIPMQVLRVFWHPMLPLVLAVAYSDGLVSIWNLADIISCVNTHDLSALPAQDLLLSVVDGSPVTYVRPNVGE